MRSFGHMVRSVVSVTTRGTGTRLRGGALVSLAVVCAGLLVWLALLPALVDAPDRPVVVGPARVSPPSPAPMAPGAVGPPGSLGVGGGSSGAGASWPGPPGTDPDPGGGIDPDPGGGALSAGDGATAVDAGALGDRLRDILLAREHAYAQRDAAMLDGIYAVDCACLRTGRAAIARLRADHAVWRGRSFSLQVERLSRVNDALWIALAVVRWGSFRIEGEDGALVRAVPAARERYRFALVRPAGGRDWLLGHASLVQELPP
jgi:hypothetical protein